MVMVRRWVTLTLIGWSQALMRLALLVCPAPDAAERARVLAAAMAGDDDDDVEPFCYTCVSSGYWQECENCGGDGLIEDDEDDGWSIRYDFADCATCAGRGGWWVCLGSERHDLEPGSIHAVPLEERSGGDGG